MKCLRLAAFPVDMVPDPSWAGNDPEGQFAYALQAQLKGMQGHEPDALTGTFKSWLVSLLADVFSGVSPATTRGGWKWTEGVNDPFYELSDSQNNLIPRPPNWFVEMIAYSPNAESRLKFDPVSGLSTPDGCQGLFDPQNGSAVAAEAWKKHRIIAQMVPERSLPATGADSPGSQHAAAKRNTLISEMIPCTTYAAARNAFNNLLKDDPNTPENEERNIDMNAMMKTDANEWPLTDVHKEDDDDPPVRAWLHSDIREKAFTHNWKVYRKFVELGNLESTSPP